MVLHGMDSSHSPVAPQGRQSLQGALAMLLPALQAGFGSGAPAAHTGFLLHMARAGALLLDLNKRRNVVRDGAVDYPSPADTRVESQAPISRYILSVLALP